MRGGERRDHGQEGQGAFEREYGFDSFTNDSNVANDAETHAMPENGAERASRRCHVHLGVARWIKKRPVNSRDLAAVIGDGGNKRRQSLGQRVGRVTIEQRLSGAILAWEFDMMKINNLVESHCLRISN